MVEHKTGLKTQHSHDSHVIGFKWFYYKTHQQKWNRGNTQNLLQMTLMFARTTKLKLQMGSSFKKRTVCLPVERRQHPHILTTPHLTTTWWRLFGLKVRWGTQSRIGNRWNRVLDDMELYMLCGDKICRITSFWTRFPNFETLENHR